MSQLISSAMVFAAGEGTRMLPLTRTTPKPLLTVNGKTLLDYALEKLVAHNIKRIVINGCYLKEQIKAHIDGLKQECSSELLFSDESKRLETGGGIVKVLSQLGSEPFFALNADIIYLDAAQQKAALTQMEEAWSDGMHAVMLLIPIERAMGYQGNGDVDLDEDGTIIVPSGQGKRPYVFSGVQILAPQLFEGAEEKPFSLYREWIFPRYRQQNGRIEGVKGVVHSGEWLHVGTPEQIKAASEYLA